MDVKRLRQQIIDKVSADVKHAQLQANKHRQQQHSSSILSSSSSSSSSRIKGTGERIHAYLSSMWSFWVGGDPGSCDIYSIAQTGDIFLERVVESGFSMSLKAGIRAAQEGNFSRTRAHLSPWNECGLVAEVDGVKYILKATPSGVKAFSLTRQLELNKTHYQKCALRPLRRTFTGIRNHDSQFENTDKILQNLCRSALHLEFSWGDSLDGSTTTGADNREDHFLQLKGMLVDRLREFTIQHTGEEVSDALKVFYMLDCGQSGSVPAERVKKAISSLLVPGVTEEKCAHIMSLITEIDANGDGDVALQEFVTSCLKIPVDKLTNEIDLVQITMAEFVACALVFSGISSGLSTDRYFLPSSFSSIVSPTEENTNTLSKRSKEVATKAPIIYLKTVASLQQDMSFTTSCFYGTEINFNVD